jgi:hypothetical protein
MSSIVHVLPVVWLIAGVLALSFVIRPSPRLPIFATRGRALIVLGAIGAVAVVAGLLTPKAPSSRPVAPPPAVHANPLFGDLAAVRARPQAYLTLESVTAFRKADGSVLLTGAVVNTTAFPIRDTRLSCRMAKGAAEAGTVGATVANAIPPGGRLIFAAVNLGKAAGPWDRQACEIVEAKAD